MLFTNPKTNLLHKTGKANETKTFVPSALNLINLSGKKKMQISH